MATASRSRRRFSRRYYDDLDETPRRPRRRLVFPAVVLLALAAVVWFAPTLVGSSPLLGSAAQRATSDLRGSLSIGGASLGWLSPVDLRDVEIRDPAGKVLLHAPRVTSTKTLLGLLMNLRDLGDFQVEGPTANIEITQQGSNLEDVIAKWLEPRDQPSATVGLRLAIKDAIVKIDDTVSGRKWQIDELRCGVSVPAASDQPLELASAGRVTPGDPAGRFDLKFKLVPPAAGKQQAATNWSDSSGDVVILTDGLTLSVLEPILRRAGGPTELAGRASTNLTCKWGPDEQRQPQATLEGQATVEKLLVAGGSLGGDRLKLDRLHVPCRITRVGQRIEVSRCDVECDVARLAVHGTIDGLAQLDRAWTKALWDSLPRSQGEIKGSVDLARLARLLPGTLRLREDLELESGAVNLQLTSDTKDGHWGGSGHLETTQIVAHEGGRRLVWDHPLVVTLAARDSQQGPIIERLNGESDFLRFEGSGTPDFFSLSASYDLQRLADELGRFLELGDLRMSGDGWSYLSWKRGEDGAFEADAEVQATNFVLARPGKNPWNDPRLVVVAAARGHSQGKSVERVDSATLKIESADDELTAALTSPVSQPTADSVWPLDVRLRGDLGRWRARLEPWVSLPDGWDVTGQADVVAAVDYGSQKIALDNVRGEFESLHAWGHGLYLDEPRVDLAAAATWTSASSQLDLKDVTINAGDARGRVQDSTISLASANPAERIGRADFQGSVATLYRWIHDPAQPADWQLSGQAKATVEATASADRSHLDLDLVIADLVAVPKSGGPWREKQVRFVTAGDFNRAADTIELSRLELTSNAVRFKATGRIDRWSRERNLKLAGTSDYDLEKISLLLEPYVGGDIHLVGRESRSFSLSGPLASAPPARRGAPPAETPLAARLDGQADFGWRSAELYGVQIGPADLRSTLSRGILRVAPSKLTVSEGTLTLAPIVQLSPSPAALFLPAGPLLENVRITPEMCQHWMMYVAPVVAGVTEAEGTFSVRMDGCRLPLSQPSTGDAAGQLTVHSVEIGPGPLVQELAVLLGRPAPAKLARESNVDFRMVQGRVYHKGLELVFPELTIRTYGSVGFDKTLAIMAEMPVPPKWLKDNPLGSTLKEQTIRLPIAGTLDRPKIDRRALDQVAAQFVREAADGFLRNELGRQIERLIPQIPAK